jgi:hypothetical protein
VAVIFVVAVVPATATATATAALAALTALALGVVLTTRRVAARAGTQFGGRADARLPAVLAEHPRLGVFVAAITRVRAARDRMTRLAGTR